MRCSHFQSDVRGIPGSSPLASLLLAVALSVTMAPAVGQDALLEKASTLLRERDAAGAYQLLARAEADHAGQPRFDYLLGIAALDAGHVTRAIFALERLVHTQPQDRLAHAELGRAYLAAGETDRAREQLRLARAGDTPPDVSTTIDRVLGLIDQVAPRSGPRLSGFVEFGLSYDSNVNSATNQGEFAIPAFGGILFQNAPESRRQHDWTAQAAGGLSAEKSVAENWTLIGAANVRTGINHEVHDMDTVLADAAIGARHATGAHSQTVAVQSGTAWVGSSRYRTANGLTAQWQSQITPTAQLSAFGQWSRQNFPHQSERSNDRSVLGLGFARSFDAGSTLAYGSAYAARERTDDAAFDALGHRAAGLRLGVEQRLRADTILFADAQVERRRHGGVEPFFDVRRLDRQHDLGVGLRYRATDLWEVSGQARYTHVASNVVLYAYTRSVIQISLRRSFP